MITQEDNDFVEKLCGWASLVGINLDRYDLEDWKTKFNEIFFENRKCIFWTHILLSRKIVREIMKYIGTTKLEHGIVMHYENSCGNIESHFIEHNS